MVHRLQWNHLIAASPNMAAALCRSEQRVGLLHINKTIITHRGLFSIQGKKTGPRIGMAGKAQFLWLSPVVELYYYLSSGSRHSWLSKNTYTAPAPMSLP
ncbi:hypothetical protein XELAEV_18002449mg [Xenopus laevis]|uniref:Uncharacterized protein n=1 Tax=Xenopus laevis TaxID=8355 RepID=A0A974BP49_XENLA|nr:hypothetical protein XELAEV_18002449mg [Xenopus laevis]